MDLTIVTFKVFDRKNSHFFENKTLEQIHQELNQIWPTYQTIKIIHCTDARIVDPQVLEKFKDNDSPDYLRGIDKVENEK